MTADPDLRRSPLAHLGEIVAGEGGRQVTLREVPFLTQINLRLDPDGQAAARVGRVLGTPLPTVPGAVATAGVVRVLWLGPDEWLVVAPDGQAYPAQRALHDALGDEPGSVVDVSANRTALDLSGPAAREVLEKGCSIDLHPRAFAPGRCAQTTVSKVNVVLWRLDAGVEAGDEAGSDACYRLLVRPSFAQYLADWLTDAMEEYRHPALDSVLRLSHG
ncbi:sarcosine oxidase subunit gamma [Streptacidiphilus fuscans]|uniref:Sarcosine oxidase subunit gamma family protein n=1 Tax=Streptacidiphilus fuscans TaxID=2789292 RepID=A0A931AXR2_9ACTN|nr:sarcosine oxidase subunit gamma family protein [Streptacidiphilus fuscans]MBF9066671.1 sarcosine oxidase subunit gamma family protein [Streptacidiphilus fuscans]